MYDDYMLCKVTLGVLKGASKLNVLLLLLLLLLCIREAGGWLGCLITDDLSLPVVILNKMTPYPYQLLNDLSLYLLCIYCKALCIRAPV
jgi:hypothetical protein